MLPVWLGRQQAGLGWHLSLFLSSSWPELISFVSSSFSLFWPAFTSFWSYSWPVLMPLSNSFNGSKLLVKLEISFIQLLTPVVMFTLFWSSSQFVTYNLDGHCFNSLLFHCTLLQFHLIVLTNLHLVALGYHTWMLYTASSSRDSTQNWHFLQTQQATFLFRFSTFLNLCAGSQPSAFRTILMEGGNLQRCSGELHVQCSHLPLLEWQCLLEWKLLGRGIVETS
jgi:hypothetical protein